jgi:hypothetical protein
MDLFCHLSMPLFDKVRMLFTYVTIFVASITLSSANPAPQLHRCKASETCWPSQSEWNSFNDSISGHLLATYPSAAVCHTAHRDVDLCKIAQQNWTNSFWRTAQPGAYSGILWELGDDQCFIDSPIDAPCGQGKVAHYYVEARGVADIQAAVKFAGKRSLYLVIKNTGHDHLGRSSGSGSFLIWTHNLKGRLFVDDFVPRNAPNGTGGIPAVTLQAGEQWLGTNPYYNYHV